MGESMDRGHVLVTFHHNDHGRDQPNISRFIIFVAYLRYLGCICIIPNVRILTNLFVIKMIDPKVMSMWDDHDAHMLWLDRYQ